MTLIGLLITLAVVGFVLWLITNYIPMDPKIKQIMVVVVVIVLVLWLLNVFVGGNLAEIRVGR